ncbi:hypothetical protein Taro_053447 [Colocasia esculenta]|uniref:Protein DETOXIFICATION n=1 Tax=Colocasia esculenta TaxID=4460 RepID=A0A843XL06_COLES|nr:hypothetical protein [Colocasia esculenta]
MEAPLLHQPGGGERGPQEGMEEWEGDCPPVKGWGGAWPVFAVESRKLWQIAVPIVFNSLSIYGINSVTQIFVGHIGSLELSAVAIALSVIGNFVTSFMVRHPTAAGYKPHPRQPVTTLHYTQASFLGCMVPLASP